MSIFDHKRLDNDTFKLDVERMREGWYTDKYFNNIQIMLEHLAREKYTFQGDRRRLPNHLKREKIDCADLEVEMQWFTRRPGKTIVVGIDKALTMLQLCTGYQDGKNFVNTADKLEVWAVEDGATVNYDGNPLRVAPVIRVHGRYRDFALLETPTLGILTRASRVATNVYNTLIAANGKPLMFFPARFDLHEVQAADGYAYQIAVQRYNLDHAKSLGPFISTDAQGDWWGGLGGGTVAHSAIATFMGDISEAMFAFARILPTDIPRIALVDFTNDCVGESKRVCRRMFDEYRHLVDLGLTGEAERYRLFGVRLDTSGSLRDESVTPLGDPALDLGVNPRLVFLVRQALDNDWETWDLPAAWKDRARDYCRSVKIVVSGGFNAEKIGRFEKLAVPVDTYAVGSSLFANCGNTVTDYTADIVRVKINGQWVDMAKTGRQALDNPDLKRVW
ncbi:MAG TPA: nicotinate phosphoribosyltransferase [Bellilinea sp.]|nr:nicotinate phosphoribosyltransferase [Bellilinea sp.]